MGKDKLCPACELKSLLRPMVRHNSYSRYVNCYICSECGMREAMQGFFWRARAIDKGLSIKPHHQHTGDENAEANDDDNTR